MAEFPALPFWTDAYISDTAHLTNEEHGVYLRLLMFAWRSPDCCLPDDDKRISIMVGLTEKKWRAIRPVIAAFWTVENGSWTQKRLTKERDFVRGKSQKNRDAAKAKWSAKALNTNNAGDANAPTGHMPERCQNDAPTPTPTPTPIKNVEDKSSTSADAPIDPSKVMFDSGVKMLGAAGVSSQQARGIIGKWRKSYADETIITAIGKAQREGAIDPVAFITRCLAAAEQSKAKAAPEIGEERITTSGKTMMWAGAVGQWVEVRK